MIQLEEKAAEALACVQKAERIMAELGHTKYSLSGMCSAAMRNDLEKEVCELLGELAEARDQRDALVNILTDVINEDGTPKSIDRAAIFLTAVKGGSDE